MDISRVPDDLLHEIFSVLISESPDFAGTIASTCRHWRTLALGCSSYWSRLDLDASKSKSLFPLRDKAALWSTRCARAQSEVTIIYGDRQFALIPLLSWITFPRREIIFRGENSFEVITPLKPNSAEEIQVGNLFHPINPKSFPRITPTEIPFYNWNLESHPSVRVAIGAVLSGVQRSLYIDGFSAPHARFTNIRRLILSFDVVSNCQEIAELMSAFPFLESLSLNAHAHPPRVCTSTLPLSFPTLQSIVVERCKYLNCLLTQLHIPNLRMLHIYGDPTAPPRLDYSTLSRPMTDGTSVPVQAPDIRRMPTNYPWPTSITTLNLSYPRLRMYDYLWIFKNLRQLGHLKLRYTCDNVVSLLCPVDQWHPLPVLRYLEIAASAPVTGAVLVTVVNSRKSFGAVLPLGKLKVLGSHVSPGERAALEEALSFKTIEG